jgi:hypothetical protein
MLKILGIMAQARAGKLKRLPGRWQFSCVKVACLHHIQWKTWVNKVIIYLNHVGVVEGRKDGWTADYQTARRILRLLDEG